MCSGDQATAPEGSFDPIRSPIRSRAAACRSDPITRTRGRIPIRSRARSEVGFLIRAWVQHAQARSAGLDINYYAIHIFNIYKQACTTAGHGHMSQHDRIQIAGVLWAAGSFFLGGPPIPIRFRYPIRP